MKSKSVINKMIWGLGAAAALCICYILSRHDMLGQWHGMYEWPMDLLFFGLLVIVVAAVFYRRKVMICTVVGYLAGFALATAFNTDGLDAGGGRTNNGWIIWAGSYLVIIFAGIVWELISKYTRNKTRSR